MSEMLGNQYFLARRYGDAQSVFEQVLAADPYNKSVKKKLIVCLAQKCEAEKCLKLFYELIKSDIDSVITTDPVNDDCPCPELIYDYENSQKQNEDVNQKTIVLGILWLFCDIEMSISYFKKAINMNKNNELLHSIYTILTSRYVKLKNEEN